MYSKSLLPLFITLIITIFIFMLNYSFLQKKSMPAVPQSSNAINTPHKETYSVIFDLNGVLFKINHKKALAHLGLMNMISYTISGHRIEHLENKLFEMLDMLKPPLRQDPDILIPLHQNKPVPAIMCDWMKGTIVSKELIEKLTDLIEQLDHKQFFASNLEKKIMQRIVTTLFDTSVRADLYTPLKQGIALLKQCSNHGHNVYLLSNMDTELMTLLKNKYPDIFALFKGMVISADVTMIKPNPDIYTYTLNTYGIDPTRCCFIDDQEENIIGAQKVGMAAIQFNEKKSKKVRSQLSTLGILSTRKSRTIHMI